MGEVIGAGELHKGVKLLIDGEPWEIVEFDFSKPGKGQAIYNCRLRNMMTIRSLRLPCSVMARWAWKRDASSMI